MGNQIIVMGMHRSGTSVITNLIHRMGAYFGEIDDEMRPSDDNPKGFWERMDVVQLNDALLEYGNSDWFRISEFDSGKLDVTPEIEQKIKAILSRFEKESPWVVKDPRYSLTFPTWIKYLDSPILVIPFRSPLEVAKSLQERNHFPIEFSIALWERYMISAIKSSNSLPVILIEYENIIANPIVQTQLLYQALVDRNVKNLKLPSNPQIEDIIDPTLKHASTAHQEEKEYLSLDQLALLNGLRTNNFEVLNDLVQLFDQKSNSEILKNWEPKVTELFERTASRTNRITSTLFFSEENRFSLKNAIRISQNSLSPNKTFKFYSESNFKPEVQVRLDIIDDISIFRLKSIYLKGHDFEILIDSEKVSTNAFYTMGSYYFFNLSPSTIFFSLPSNDVIDSLPNEVVVEIEVLGKGISVLPHVNQFHKNFCTYEKRSEGEEKVEIEGLMLALTAEKDRSIIKGKAQIVQLEFINHKLSENIKFLQGRNQEQLELINRISENYERKIQQVDDLTRDKLKITENLILEKETHSALKKELQSAIAENDNKLKVINQLNTSIAEKESQKQEIEFSIQDKESRLQEKELEILEIESQLQEKELELQGKQSQIDNLSYELSSQESRKNSLITHFENEITNLKGSLSYQVGRVITLPFRIIFDFFTRKKPFNQTGLWWIKQHILHPKAIFGNQEERVLLKKDWSNQRQLTAELLRIEQNRTFGSQIEAATSSNQIPIETPRPENNIHTQHREKVLYISPNLPDFDTSSGGKRATRMLGLLSEEFDVYAFTLGSKPQKYIDALQRNGVIVIRTTNHREVQRKLPQIHTIIYAWYDTYFTSAAFRHLYPDAKVIVDSVDVHWVREKRSIGIWEGLTLEKVAANQKRELEAYQNADIVWAVTETDKSAILDEIPKADVRVVSNIHESVLNEYTDNQNNSLLFIGGYNHYPNVSAVKLLAQKIFPEVRKAIPDAQLIIAGANAPTDVKELSNVEGVMYKGFIEEDKIEALYEQSFLTVSPLLAGAGIKGKICESIAYRTPVVTNDIGNEGINLVHEEEGLICSIEEMPDVIINALNRKYNFDHMTQKAQDKLSGLVGPQGVKQQMVNSILPEISICIVTWNKKELVKRCIESIEGNTLYPNYKILVHSNGCTDGTQDYLKSAAKINHRIVPILSDKNDVFVLPNNWMMERFPENDVVLINNDVYVTKGWLSALQQTAYSSPDYGIVGSKILYPDGRLQEFGSELYNNGTGRNIGKFDDPNKEEYKKLTEVGYVSGCSMYIKRSTIKRIGVFDEQFHPCYCEDSDYCYTAKEHGIRTVVTPNSVIFHDEGGTSGTDTSSGMKKYQVVNMEKFLKKHKSKLTPA